MVGVVLARGPVLPAKVHIPDGGPSWHSGDLDGTLWYQEVPLDESKVVEAPPLLAEAVASAVDEAGSLPNVELAEEVL